MVVTLESYLSGLRIKDTDLCTGGWRLVEDDDETY